jgi:hypothetical protein
LTDFLISSANQFRTSGVAEARPGAETVEIGMDCYHRWLGKRLRAAHPDVVDMQIPKPMINLLRRLREVERPNRNAAAKEQGLRADQATRTIKDGSTSESQ